MTVGAVFLLVDVVLFLLLLHHLVKAVIQSRRDKE